MDTRLETLTKEVGCPCQSVGASDRTLYQVLEESARKHGDAPALRQPSGADTLTYSWTQYKEAAEEIAAGPAGARHRAAGDVVAVNSETRLEFYLADLGIITNGSIAAAMYPSYPPAELVKTLAGSQARAPCSWRMPRRSVRCATRP